MATQQKREWVPVTTEPTKHWCRKMRTHFVASVGKKGYITKEEVMERAYGTPNVTKLKNCFLPLYDAFFTLYYEFP